MRFLDISISVTTLLLLPFTAAAQPASPFKHVIIVFQENRTPDNLFGSNPTFEPGVDIATSGKNSLGLTVPLTATPMSYCYDISHMNSAFVQAYDGGKMDGADLERVLPRNKCSVPADPQYKFVDNSTAAVQPYFDIARQFGFANRMFQTNQGPSFPAHQIIFGGTSAPTVDSPLFAAENMAHRGGGSGCTANRKQRVAVIDASGSETSNPAVYPCFDRPTLAETLDAAQISWRYYADTMNPKSIWNAPAAIKKICVAAKQGSATKCTGPDYVNNVTTVQAQILTDISNCKLPAVSWVIPDVADSDHASYNTGGGPSWVASIVNAVGNQAACSSADQYWNDTAILITWDDWGGWYDHVPPYHTGGQQNGWGAGYTFGFRVPLLVVSAYTPAGYVDNNNHDFGSILAFVETNFGLRHIGPGTYADAYADTLLPFFTLTTPRSFPNIPAKLGSAYFLHQKRSLNGPDDD